MNCARGLGTHGFARALFLGCLLASPTVATAKTSLQDLNSADWSVNAPCDLAHNPPTKDAVWSFIGHLPGRLPDLGKLCDFRFADLRRQGTLSLVVSDDAGGTADCNDVEIFDKSAGTVEQYYLPPGTAYLGDPGVEDINGNGHFEVVVDEIAGVEYERSRSGTYLNCEACIACYEYWPRVYGWTGNGYTDVSSQYPKYYERELASLKRQMAVASGPRDLDCLKAEAVKIKHFLDISKDAGMTDAITWANRTNPGPSAFERSP